MNSKAHTGITFKSRDNSQRPQRVGFTAWDSQVHDERLYDRILSGGTLALGESYVDGWWDVPDLTEFFSRLAREIAPTQHITPALVWGDTACKGQKFTEQGARVSSGGSALRHRQ